jgi:hypothetical protein
VSSKHFLLLKRVLAEIEYNDTSLVDDLILGTELTGKVAKSSVFPPKFKPASMDPDDLIKNGRFTRRSVIESIRSSGDDEIDMTVWQQTTDEISQGWLSDDD